MVLHKRQKKWRTTHARRLFIGSEGTLGVVTECTLRLHPIPAYASAATCAFSDTEGASGLHGAANAVVALLQSAIPVSKSELLDASTIRAFNAYNRSSGLDPLPDLPHLFLEIGGTSEGIVSEYAELARQICDDFGALGFDWATDDATRDRLWAARHSTYYASLALRPEAKGFVTDVCVPLSSLADVLLATADDVMAYGVVGPARCRAELFLIPLLWHGTGAEGPRASLSFASLHHTTSRGANESSRAVLC